MTTKWQIVQTVSGVEIGVFEGETKADALDAMARDAGYDDYAAMRAATEDAEEEPRHRTPSALRVTEVE